VATVRRRVRGTSRHHSPDDHRSSLPARPPAAERPARQRRVRGEPSESRRRACEPPLIS
jgi:hypothetical protein